MSTKYCVAVKELILSYQNMGYGDMVNTEVPYYIESIQVP